MKDKRQRAIYNNNGLYEAIFANHRIKFTRTEFIRYSLEKTPPLYSNLVTISRDWQPDDIFRSIDDNYEKEKWNEWSIKDSFGVLDLSEYGFTKLFDAQWMYLEAGKFTAIEKRAEPRYEIISKVDVLAMWRIAWDSDKELGKEIFDPKLLNDSNVFFVAGYEGDKITSGCLVNKTGDVLGISNFFAPDKNIEYWSGAIAFIFDSIGRTDIVGYERKEMMRELQPLGFEATGNLTVWVKKKFVSIN